MDDKTKVKTDHKWHDFLDAMELPAKVRQHEFDYMTDAEFEEDYYIKYLGNYYALSEFEVLNKDKNWDGVHTTSMFSAILIKIDERENKYKIARCYW